MDELLGLFRYPPGSVRALLAGSRPLRRCAARFACRTHTWRLPVSGHVDDLVAASIGAVQEVDVDGVGQEVHWVSGSGSGRKRIRLNRKTPAHLAGSMIHSRPRVWESCVMWDFPVFPSLITRGGVVIRLMEDLILLRSGLGFGNSLGCAGPRLQVCTPF